MKGHVYPEEWRVRKIKNFTGKKFGRFTVIEHLGMRGHNSYWLCRCECGKLKEVRKDHLGSGHSKSCGCLASEKAAERNKARLGKGAYLHDGHFSRILYFKLSQMKQRCYNPNYVGYKYYGGKGVKVCDEWKNNFRAFRNWALATGYENGLTIDRIDNDGNYCPENCQWLTASENLKKQHRDAKRLARGVL